MEEGRDGRSTPTYYQSSISPVTSLRTRIWPLLAYFGFWLYPLFQGHI